MGIKLWIKQHKFLAITIIVGTFLVISALIFYIYRRRKRKKINYSNKKFDAKQKKKLLRPIPENSELSPAIITSVSTTSRQSIKLNVVQKLEQDTQQNRKYASEFLRAARKIETYLQREKSSNYKELISFLETELELFVRALVKHKIQIEDILNEIENGTIEYQGVIHTNFDEDIVYELSAKQNKFASELNDHFEKEHQQLLTDLEYDPEDEKIVEYVEELRHLYQHHINQYESREEWMILQAIEMQKLEQIPSEDEMSDSLINGTNESKTNTCTDPDHYSVQNDIENTNMHRTLNHTASKPTKSSIAIGPLVVIIGFVIINIVLFLLYKAGKLNGTVQWMKLHKVLTLIVMVVMIAITILSCYWWLRLPSKQKDEDRMYSERKSKLLEP